MSESKALFLDRDGVINVEYGYVHRHEDFHFHTGIFELCRAAQDLGYILIVVTNQAGIARGFYTEAEFLELTDWMTEKFAERKIHLARVYYCPYHPVHGVGDYKIDSLDRKPGPGMFLRARADFDLNLTSSVLVGDKPSDILAGKAAGVGTAILLKSEFGQEGLNGVEYHFANSLDDVRRDFFTRPAKTA